MTENGQRYYVKRFMIEHPDQRRNIYFRTCLDSKLQIVAYGLPSQRLKWSYFQNAVLRTKVIIALEEYIAVKGIKALGNQLTAEKIKRHQPIGPASL